MIRINKIFKIISTLAQIIVINLKFIHTAHTLSDYCYFTRSGYPTLCFHFFFGIKINVHFRNRVIETHNCVDRHRIFSYVYTIKFIV